MRGVRTLIIVNFCSATKCPGAESALAVECLVVLLFGGAKMFEKFTRTEKFLELFMILFDRHNYY